MIRPVMAPGGVGKGIPDIKSAYETRRGGASRCGNEWVGERWLKGPDNQASAMVMA